MITRTFACLNRFCMHQFNATNVENPSCVRCGGKKTKWLPQPFAIMGERTKQIDKDVKKLTFDSGNTNFRSPRKYESMAPKLNPTPVKGRTRRFEPQQGWGLDVPLDGAGREMSYCGPTGVTAKMKADIGSRRAPIPESPTQTGSIPAYEGSWRPPGGIPR